MKSFVKLLAGTLVVTACVVLGVATVRWLNVPFVFLPWAFFPACFVVTLLERRKFDWVRIPLLFLGLGIFSWTYEIAVVSGYASSDLLPVIVMLVIIFFPAHHTSCDPIRNQNGKSQSRKR